MRHRHRTPSIFSMSMLDVLCCALGAVILLMLLNFVTAYNKAQALSVSEKELKQSSREFKDSQANLQLTKSDLSTSMELIDSLRAQVNKLTGDVNSARNMASNEKNTLEARLKKLDQELITTKSLLKQAEIDRESAEALLA